MSVGATSSDLGSRLRGVDRRTRRRRRINVLMVGVCSFAALLAVAMLALIVFTVVIHGFRALSLDFFTQPTPQLAVGQSEGAGVANAIIGSLLIVAIATLIAVPIGVLVAVFTSEFAGTRTSQLVRLSLDVLNGVPSVVIGIFVFGLLVVGHGQAAWIAGVALAIIEVPLIARSTQEVLNLVPVSLRDASAALGARHWKTVVRGRDSDVTRRNRHGNVARRCARRGRDSPDHLRLLARRERHQLGSRRRRCSRCRSRSSSTPSLPIQTTTSSRGRLRSC